MCKTSSSSTSSSSSSSLEICRFDTIQSNREGDKDTQRRATTFGETCGLDGSVNVRHVCLGCSVHNILYLGKHGAVSGCRAEDFIPIYVRSVPALIFEYFNPFTLSITLEELSLASLTHKNQRSSTNYRKLEQQRSNAGTLNFVSCCTESI